VENVELFAAIGLLWASSSVSVKLSEDINIKGDPPSDELKLFIRLLIASGILSSAPNAIYQITDYIL
jgi:hypothetical protein